MVVQPTRRWFTTTEYHQMIEAGILKEDDRLELIEGEVVNMTPIGRRHFACVARLTRLFFQKLGDDAIVSIQNPVELTEFTEPQPDCAILQPQPDFYASGLPTPENIFLLVEVSDSSVDDIDRRVKVPRYARSRVPELWLVDLEQETLTVYADPSSEGYRSVRVLRHGDQVAPSAFPDRLFQVADILA